MLNFTINNVKFLFLAISLIHQLTTPKDERRMSEGKSASWRSRVCTPRWRKAAACAQFKIQNSKFKIHPLANFQSLPKFFIPPIQNSKFKIHNRQFKIPH